MSEAELQVDPFLGLCIKDTEGNIISQNKKCIEICGKRAGEKCEEGCMLRYRAKAAKAPFDEGAFFFRNVKVRNLKSDVLQINDGKYLISVLIESEPSIQKKFDYIKKYQLTKTELNIASKLLHGLNNREIAAELFICKGTLRTHLNNIYRKVPPAVKNQLLYIHNSKKNNE